jgi:hypothetical protein
MVLTPYRYGVYDQPINNANAGIEKWKPKSNGCAKTLPLGAADGLTPKMITNWRWNAGDKLQNCNARLII